VSAFVKLILLLCCLSFIAGAVIHYQPLEISQPTSTELSTPNAGQSNYDWQSVLLSFKQFEPVLSTSKDLDTQTPATEAIDPNDITKAALVGIFADTPQQVILVVASVDSNGNAITTENTKTLNVRLNETILDGWKLVEVSSDSVKWQHTSAGKSYLQFLFSPTQDQKTDN